MSPKISRVTPFFENCEIVSKDEQPTHRAPRFLTLDSGKGHLQDRYPLGRLETSMRVGVVSDTHTDSIDQLPRGLLGVLTGMDMVLHAGDFTERPLLDELRRMRNFTGVYGNLDSFDVKKQLHAIETVEAGGFRIGLNHPAEGGAPLNLEDRLRPKFQDVHAIVFGHSHQPMNETKGGVLFFNPRQRNRHSSC